MASATTIYDFKPEWKKSSFDMAQLKGKVVLIVNTASQCGFTPQFEGLETLYKKYKDQGLEIIGFPCNQFGNQDPDTNENISSFCQVNYGVSFPMMNKIDVNGDHEHPVYKYLKSQKSGLLGLTRIKWNFEKFTADRSGQIVNRYSSLTKPESLEADIVKLLNGESTSRRGSKASM